MTKKQLFKYATTLSRYDFDGERLTDIRDMLGVHIAQYGEGARLDVTLYNDDVEFSIEGCREETDEEYAARLEREQAIVAATEANERALLARLQAKYGP